MSVDLIKSISIDPIRKSIRVTSACNNVTPRRYATWNPLPDGGHFTFESWMEAFARDCFGGSAQFLPSCESKAHEAYLRTCAEMGGDWAYAHKLCGEDFEHDYYKQFRDEWCKKFIDFCLSGKRDPRKFAMTRYGRTVTISVRRSPYGGLTGHYRYTDKPKAVSWTRKERYIKELDGFDAVEV